MTRCFRSAVHKTSRARGGPVPTLPGRNGATAGLIVVILILLRFHIDRNIPQSSDVAVESRETILFQLYREFSMGRLFPFVPGWTTTPSECLRFYPFVFK